MVVSLGLHHDERGASEQQRHESNKLITRFCQDHITNHYDGRHSRNAVVVMTLSSTRNGNHKDKATNDDDDDDDQNVSSLGASRRRLANGHSRPDGTSDHKWTRRHRGFVLALAIEHGLPRNGRPQTPSHPINARLSKPDNNASVDAGLRSDQ